MLADGNCTLSKALGLDIDASKAGMGQRCRRFAAIIDQGVVSHLFIENPGEFEVSSAEHIIQFL